MRWAADVILQNHATLQCTWCARFWNSRSVWGWVGWIFCARSFCKMRETLKQIMDLFLPHPYLGQSFLSLLPVDIWCQMHCRPFRYMWYSSMDVIYIVLTWYLYICMLNCSPKNNSVSSAFQISFCSAILGDFDEEFSWQVDGAPEPLRLRITWVRIEMWAFVLKTSTPLLLWPVGEVSSVRLSSSVCLKSSLGRSRMVWKYSQLLLLTNSVCVCGSACANVCLCYGFHNGV